MPESPQRKWQSFGSTLLEFANGARIDLRKTLGARERETLQAQGLRDTFAVMTAENPYGESPEESGSAHEARRREEENVEETVTLARILEQRGVPAYPVETVSSDGAWRETCFAFPASVEESRALARDFRQLAFFFWDGDRFWLYPGVMEEAPRALPVS